MQPLDEFRAMAERVRNWGRWGGADERGTLNLLDAGTARAAAAAVRTGRVFPLGATFGSSGPQSLSPVRTNPIHLMTVDGGDASSLAGFDGPTGLGRAADYIATRFRDDLFRFNDDYVMMPLQASTQWDSLAHAYYEDTLYNGFPASTVTSQGARHCGIDKVGDAGIVARGVLADVAGARTAVGRGGSLDPITADELDAVLEQQGVELHGGDILVVRTGWWTAFTAEGTPAVDVGGVDWRVAEWLHDAGIVAIAADHPTVEDVRIHVPGAYLPFHLLCLRDMGLMLGEFWVLDELAADCASDGVWEFQLIASPLAVAGGVGSPVNPLAIK
jgi:kynurenine formamidase